MDQIQNETQIQKRSFRDIYKDLIKSKQRKSFFINLFYFLLTTIIFVVINLLYSKDYIWFVYPMLAGGISVGVQAVSTFVLGGRTADIYANEAELLTNK